MDMRVIVNKIVNFGIPEVSLPVLEKKRPPNGSNNSRLFSMHGMSVKYVTISDQI